MSYNYYYWSFATSDFMQYKDVEYNGEKYRAVTFSNYRRNGLCGFSDDSVQESNGYETNSTYWFKYEPLRWRVLDPDEGLVTCESIIDSQQFYHKREAGTQTGNGENFYTNSYKYSDVRAFLTDAFYNLAFTSGEKSLLVPTTVNGTDLIYSKNISTYLSEGNGDVTDSVFLLSYTDVSNVNYGFVSESDRTARGTDYAKCQGLTVESAGNSRWWIRSAHYATNFLTSEIRMLCQQLQAFGYKGFSDRRLL